VPPQPDFNENDMVAYFVKADPRDYVIFEVWFQYASLRHGNGKGYVPFKNFEDDYLVNYLPKRMNIDAYERVFTIGSGKLSTDPLT